LNIFWLKYRGSRIALRGGETVVGRSPYCSVVINSRRVSRQHCALKVNGEALILSDLGSANGTWVNGEAISGPTHLRDGDLIELGDESLEVQVNQPLPPREAPATEKDLPIYFMESEDDAEQTTVTQAQTSSIALIESLVANGSSANSPTRHFGKVQRAVEKYLGGKLRVESSTPQLELTRLRRSIEATQRLDDSAEANAWRERVLAELRDSGAASPVR